MDHIIIKFRCVSCKQLQQVEKFWKEATTQASKPTMGNKSKAEVTCPACKTKQVVLTGQ